MSHLVEHLYHQQFVVGRQLLHLPLATVVLAVMLVALLAIGAVEKWWTRSVRLQDAALALALTALAVQLTSWQLVGLPP